MPLATSESISDSGSEDESGLCLSPFTACEDGDQSDDWQELAQKLREDYLKECFDENGRFLQYDKDDKKQGCKSAIRTVNCSEAIKVYVDLAPQELKRVDDQKGAIQPDLRFAALVAGSKLEELPIEASYLAATPEAQWPEV